MLGITIWDAVYIFGLFCGVECRDNVFLMKYKNLIILPITLCLQRKQITIVPRLIISSGPRDKDKAKEKMQ